MWLPLSLIVNYVTDTIDLLWVPKYNTELGETLDGGFNVAHLHANICKGQCQCPYM